MVRRKSRKREQETRRVKREHKRHEPGRKHNVVEEGKKVLTSENGKEYIKRRTRERVGGGVLGGRRGR